MKRIITKLGMMMAMLLSFLPVSAYDFEVDGIYYEVISVSDLTCKAVAGPKEYQYTGDIVVPEKVVYNNKELTVTDIGDAFYRCKSLTSISLPNSIDYISDYAFSGCSSLISIGFPNSLIGIRSDAFYECSSLTSINLPNSVTIIGASAFEHCTSLTTVAFPNSLTYLGFGAFEECDSLTAVDLPDTLITIEDRAFRSCHSLSSVILGNSLETIGEGAFMSCPSLTSINIPNKVKEIGRSAFSNTSLVSIIIPNSVNTIGWCAFRNCSSLETIQLSENLSKLEYGTFNGCSKLTSINIPGRVKSLTLYRIWEYPHEEDYLFGGCENLKELILPYGDQVLEAKYYTFILDSGGEYSTDLSFYGRSIGYAHIEKAYIDRELVNNIELPYLKNYSIGEHMTTNQVDLSKSENLETVNCLAAEPPILGKVTNAQYMNLIVKVPEESLEAYQQADGWKNFWNLQGFDPAGVEEFGTSTSERVEVGRYNLNGQKVSEDYDGIVIVRYSDGSTRKMIQK